MILVYIDSTCPILESTSNLGHADQTKEGLMLGVDGLEPHSHAEAVFRLWERLVVSVVLEQPEWSRHGAFHLEVMRPWEV
jgi:hypothetical protein